MTINAVAAPMLSRSESSMGNGRAPYSCVKDSPRVASATQPRPRLAISRPNTTTTYHGHGDAHQHAPGSGHVHASHASVRALRVAVALTALLMLLEIAGGLMSNSVALLADAGHMLTDVAALSLSLFVAWFCRPPEAERRTYGYLRWEILAALINGTTLLLISVWIIWRAVDRFRTPQQISGGLMLGVAT